MAIGNVSPGRTLPRRGSWKGELRGPPPDSWSGSELPAVESAVDAHPNGQERGKHRAFRVIRGAVCRGVQPRRCALTTNRHLQRDLDDWLLRLPADPAAGDLGGTGLQCRSTATASPPSTFGCGNRLTSAWSGLPPSAEAKSISRSSGGMPPRATIGPRQSRLRRRCRWTCTSD
jgi:hypothetical protein